MSRKSMIKPYKHCKKCGALIVNGDLCEDCKPMTNADRIRQMTDYELAEWFAPHMMCELCDKKDKPFGCNKDECMKYALIYMKKVVSEDARTD